MLGFGVAMAILTGMVVAFSVVYKRETGQNLFKDLFKDMFNK